MSFIFESMGVYYYPMKNHISVTVFYTNNVEQRLNKKAIIVPPRNNHSESFKFLHVCTCEWTVTNVIVKEMLF